MHSTTTAFTSFEIKCKQKGIKDNIKQKTSNPFQGIKNDTSVFLQHKCQKPARCNLKIWMDGGPIHVSLTTRPSISFELISAFPAGSPIFQEHYKVTYTSQRATMPRYHFCNDTEVMLTLLPQDYTKKGHISGGQIHKQLNSKRHITMVSANMNASIQRPCIWWVLAGVFWVLANSNIFSTFWN